MGSGNRNLQVDFAKGMLIWSVIWGHTITALSAGKFDSPAWIHLFFRTYDLPLFMILSGYFFRHSCEAYPVKELLFNKIGMLLVPILFWNLVNGSWSAFYFLWAVFVSSLICIPLRKLCNMFRIPVMLSITVLFHIINIPWNMFYLFPFFCTGFLFGQPFTEKKECPIIVVIAFVAGLCLWKPDYTPWQTGYDAWKSDISALAVYLFRFTLALAGSFVMVQFFYRLKESIPSKVSAFFCGIGRKTLALYVLQTFIVEKALNSLILTIDSSLYDIAPELVQALTAYAVAPLMSMAVIMLANQIIFILEKSVYSRWVFGTKFDFLCKKVD